MAATALNRSRLMGMWAALALIGEPSAALSEVIVSRPVEIEKHERGRVDKKSLKNTESCGLFEDETYWIITDAPVEMASFTTKGSDVKIRFPFIRTKYGTITEEIAQHLSVIDGGRIAAETPGPFLGKGFLAITPSPSDRGAEVIMYLGWIGQKLEIWNVKVDDHAKCGTVSAQRIEVR